MLKELLKQDIQVNAKLTKADAGRDLDAAQEATHSNKRLLANVAAAWNQLTADEQQSWDAVAPSFPAKNKYGDIYTPSGYQVFMKLNCNLQLINEPILKSGPVANFPTLPPIDPPCCEPPELLKFTFVGGIPNDIKVLFFACNQVLRGSSFRKGKEKLLGVAEPNESGVIDVTYQYQNIFGKVKPGAVIFFRIVPVSRITGQQGVEQIVKVVKPNFLPIPSVWAAIPGITNQEISNGKPWLIPFRAFGFNLTGPMKLSLIDPTQTVYRIGRTESGPWLTEFNVELNQLGQPAQNVFYLKIVAPSTGLVGGLVLIESAGATSAEWGFGVESIDQFITIGPAPVAFGDVYSGVGKVIEISNDYGALRNKIVISIAGGDANRFVVGDTPDGPWSQTKVCEPEVKPTRPRTPIYAKCLPGSTGSLSANVIVTSGTDITINETVTANCIDGAVTSPNSPGDNFGDQNIGSPFYPDFGVTVSGAGSPCGIFASSLVNCTVQFSKSITGPWANTENIVPVAGFVPLTQIFMKVTPTAAGAFSFDVGCAGLGVAPLTLSYTGNAV